MAEPTPLVLNGAYMIRAGSSVTAEGSAELRIGPDGVFIAPGAGPPTGIPYTDMEAILCGEHVITVPLRGGQVLQLRRLGGRFDEAFLALRQCHVDALSVALLVAEPTVVEAFGAEFASHDSVPAEAEVRLYDTRLGVFPYDGAPLVAEYSELAGISFDAASYRVVFSLVGGGQLWLGKLGRRSQDLPDQLNALRARASGWTQQALQRLFPSLPGLTLAQLAGTMRHGFAVCTREFVNWGVDPWAAIEALLPGADSEGTLARTAIRDTCPDGQAWIGVAVFPGSGFFSEQSQLDPVTDESGSPADWMVYALGLLPGGRSIAYEVLTAEDCATYGFRIEAESEWSELLRCLRRVQFRREPISVAEADLATAKAGRYALAARVVPELQWLRQRFLGRALHTSVDAWLDAVRRWQD
ncbi:MAG TPA: hypothetical protein PLD23_05510 [Armatimonadota bacterium]|nr:hypothetical protein [Armatimonadota bacterium]